MKLFVTGGAGFIGSAVVREAVARGHVVLNVDKLTYASNPDNLASVETNARYHFAQADIRDGTRMRALMDQFRPDIVMHLAAESHVDRSIDGPSSFIETNINGTFRLLEAARGYISSDAAPQDFRFVHISTDEVFGSLGPRGAFTEESHYRPNSPYSASKASSDLLVRAWSATFGLPVVISNCSNNYGPYQFPEKLIPVVTLAARDGKQIPVYGNGANVRDWLHVDDHAEALLLIAQKGRLGETYCIGGGTELSNLDLVRRICQIMDQRFPNQSWGGHENLISFVTDRPGHDARYAIDYGKIETELGWSPSRTIDDALPATVDWYLENTEWLKRIEKRGFDRARIGLGVAQSA